MSRRPLLLSLLACAALLGACGGDDAGQPGTSSDGRPTDAAGMDGQGVGRVFALVRGRDTLLIERYTLQGNAVQGVMRDPTGGRVEYETVHGGQGAESSMRISITPSGPDAGPPLVSTFTLRGDSVYLSNARGDSAVQQADALPAGTLPYMAPSIGMMALLAQSARGVAGDSGQVGILAASISQNPVHVRPLVMWRGDTAWVVGNETNQFRLIFQDGELMSFENPPQQMRGVLMPASAAAAPPADGGTPAAGEAAPGTASSGAETPAGTTP